MALAILDLAATTFKLSRGDFQNNVYFKNALTAQLKSNGSVTSEEGGVTCDETLAYAKNTNFGSTRGYDTIEVDPMEEFTAASFSWGELAGAVSISKREIKLNRGAPQIKKLITMKKNGGLNSASSMMEDMFFGNGSGNGGKNPLGLLAIAPVDPTDDNLGGIDSGDFSFWRSKQLNDADSTYTSGADTAVSFASNGQRLMQEMYPQCSLGSGVEAPDFIMCDRSTWLRYQRSLLDKVRYTQDAKIANYGFKGIQFFGANMMWTDRIGATAKTIAADGYQVTFPVAGAMFFLNTKHIYVREQQSWEAGSFLEPVNQRAYACKIDWMGQMTTDLRRVQGQVAHFID